MLTGACCVLASALKLQTPMSVQMRLVTRFPMHPWDRVWVWRHLGLVSPVVALTGTPGTLTTQPVLVRTAAVRVMITHCAAGTLL
jgi:hypothetical protein